MSPDDQAAIHTRIDYMEDGLKTQIGNLAESMAAMAKSIEKISDKLADQSLLIERSNQHAAQIDNLDKRMDTLEKKVPVYDLYTGWVKYIGYAVSAAIALALVGTVLYI